uniref:hypothetical protein n=1 Tax=Sphingomonas populi TaxID=2484750 RepID=UPI0019D2A7F0|nr:hypothetical protein [Sphingomonas populi]
MTSPRSGKVATAGRSGSRGMPILGSQNRVRNDLFVSGPINKNLTFAIGGFFRTSNGVRDPGFTANKGGQIRGNLKFTSDDETLNVIL